MHRRYMPNQTDAQVETISMDEHKKLQRKFDRRNKTATKAEQAVEALQSDVSRLEALFESFMQVVVGDDDKAKLTVEQLLSSNKERRSKDMTSAELTARLGRILDENDVDWDDDRFEPARKILDEINSTGDLSRAAELERLVQKAVEPPEEDFNARVEAEVAKRIQSNARVDTGQSVNTGGSRVRRSDLQYNPSEGIEGLRKRLEQAQTQLSG